MRVIALVCLLLQASSSALAQPKPTTEMMLCERLQALVAMHGAAVLNTGPGTALRFIAHPGSCTHGEVAEPVYLPTQDDPRCPVLICQSANRRQH
jgi:hypothetical protein